MEIVHVYAKNIKIFDDAVKDTECRVNAYTSINSLIKSLTSFNARDVLGLVVFSNPITKGCLRLIDKFDDLFVFKETPIIVVSDNAEDFVNSGVVRVKHSKLMALNSVEDSLSDSDLNRIFATLVLYNSKVYDLSVCGMGKEGSKYGVVGEKVLDMSDDLKGLLSELKL